MAELCLICGEKMYVGEASKIEIFPPFFDDSILVGYVHRTCFDKDHVNVLMKWYKKVDWNEIVNKEGWEGAALMAKKKVRELGSNPNSDKCDVVIPASVTHEKGNQ